MDNVPKITPRTVGEESTTQDNVVKQPYQMATPDNTAGNESGVSDTAGRGTTATQDGVPFAPATYVNIEASTENRSAQFKHPQASQEVPEGAKGQYQ